MNDLKKIFQEELNKRKSKENTDLSKVQNYGWALEYIHESKRTPEICLAAVQQDGRSISYVPVDIIEEIVKSF